jgi:hypothetical protein
MSSPEFDSAGRGTLPHFTPAQTIAQWDSIKVSAKMLAHFSPW